MFRPNWVDVLTEDGDFVNKMDHVQRANHGFFRFMTVIIQKGLYAILKHAKVLT
jgi:hypothetical protein